VQIPHFLAGFMRVYLFARPIRAALLLAVCATSLCAEVLRIPEAQAKRAATSKPAPTISPMARSLKISGHVEVQVSIDQTGDVSEVKPTQGPPVLSTGVVEAVKKWKFTPFTDASGTASAAITSLGFDFKQ
jgi:TonB family protein